MACFLWSNLFVWSRLKWGKFLCHVIHQLSRHDRQWYMQVPHQFWKTHLPVCAVKTENTGLLLTLMGMVNIPFFRFMEGFVRCLIAWFAVSFAFKPGSSLDLSGDFFGLVFRLKAFMQTRGRQEPRRFSWNGLVRLLRRPLGKLTSVLCTSANLSY